MAGEKPVLGCVEPSLLQPATQEMKFGLSATELRRIGVDCVVYSEDYNGRHLHIGNDINDTQLGTYLLIASLFNLWGWVNSGTA